MLASQQNAQSFESQIRLVLAFAASGAAGQIVTILSNWSGLDTFFLIWTVLQIAILWQMLLIIVRTQLFQTKPADKENENKRESLLFVSLSNPNPTEKWQKTVSDFLDFFKNVLFLMVSNLCLTALNEFKETSSLDIFETLAVFCLVVFLFLFLLTKVTNLHKE